MGSRSSVLDFMPGFSRIWTEYKENILTRNSPISIDFDQLGAEISILSPQGDISSIYYKSQDGKFGQKIRRRGKLSGLIAINSNMENNHQYDYNFITLRLRVPKLGDQLEENLATALPSTS